MPVAASRFHVTRITSVRGWVGGRCGDRCWLASAGIGGQLRRYFRRAVQRSGIDHVKAGLPSRHPRFPRRGIREPASGDGGTVFRTQPHLRAPSNPRPRMWRATQRARRDSRPLHRCCLLATNPQGLPPPGSLWAVGRAATVCEDRRTVRRKFRNNPHGRQGLTNRKILPGASSSARRGLPQVAADRRLSGLPASRPGHEPKFRAGRGLQVSAVRRTGSR